jgi:phosphate:Na+ symporter
VTANRWAGVATGAVTTAVMQSSSATTVLVVGFVAAGLMTFVGSLGVILGANIGTTITAQVVAFDVVEWALGIVAVGFLTTVVARNDRVEGWGAAILGLGLVFVGMGAMGASMAPLRDDPAVAGLLAGLADPLAGVTVGLVFTALVQSSSATTVLVIVLASEGLLGLEAGVAVVIGANVGTSVTAIIASIGRIPDAKRAAAAHVLFNTLGAAFWLVLLTPLVALAELVSPSYPGLAGDARLAAEVPRQLANAHTIFNVANVLLFVWVLHPIDRLLHRLVPDRDPMAPVSEPVFLDPELHGTPALALAAAARELRRLGDLVLAMLEQAPSAVLAGPRGEVERVRAADVDVDILYDHIIGYLARLSEERLMEGESQRLLTLLEAANALESIADLVETNLAGLGQRRLDTGVLPSLSTRILLEELFASTVEILTDALSAVVDQDEDAARRVRKAKAGFNRRLDAARLRQAGRLTATEHHRRILYAIEIDVIDVIKRIEYLSRHMVRPAPPKEDGQAS